jgi:sulfate-transporting ATPase
MIWAQYSVFGLGVGAVFALLATGIVLVYRASGVLNLAHASIGVTGAFINFTLLDHVRGLPVGVALLIALLAGAGLGYLADALVFRHIENASQVVKLLVSFGLAGVLQGAVNLIWSRSGPPSSANHTLFPMFRGWHLAGVVITEQRTAIIVAGLLVTVALTVLVKRTRYGVHVRALAQNPLAARLAGINDRRIRSVTWALGGATAALAAVLIVPFGPMNPLALSGDQLMAMAAALVGGLVSLPAALVGGIGLGVVQQLLVAAPAPWSESGTAVATLLILALLFLRVERFFVSEQEARAVEGDERLFRGGSAVPAVGRPRTWLLVTGVVVLAQFATSGFAAFVITRVALYALLGLSLVVLTGMSGQVSLMPGTFAGVGACLGWVFSAQLGLDPLVAIPLAALVTIPLCALVGVAALRLRPLYLAVATLALAQTFDDTVFQSGWLANGGQRMTVARPHWLAGDHVFAAVAIGVVGALFAFTVGFTRSRTGRALRMVRDNPKGAAAGGVNPTKYRLLAFTLSAGYAGTAGALLGFLLTSFTSQLFSFQVLSLTAFGLAAVGGIRSPLGSVIGATILIEANQLLPQTPNLLDWITVAVGVGIVVAMARNPDGLSGLLQLRPRPVVRKEVVRA